MTTGNLQKVKFTDKYFFFFYSREEGIGKYSNRTKKKKKKSLVFYDSFYDSFLLLPMVVYLKLEPPDSECIYLPLRS